MGRQQKYPRVYPHASCIGIPLGQYNSFKLLNVTSNVNYVYMGSVVSVALIVVVVSWWHLPCTFHCCHLHHGGDAGCGLLVLWS